MTSNYPFVSIVIPMFNEEEYIGKCLASVMSQDYPLNRYEAIVVDGNSEDSSVDIVSEMSKVYNNIHLLQNTRKITPASFNIGIKKSSGEIISIFSAHSIAPNNYISICVKHLLETEAEHVTGGIKPISNTYWGKSIGRMQGL